jgi:hypothetical protein
VDVNDLMILKKNYKASVYTGGDDLKTGAPTGFCAP